MKKLFIIAATCLSFSAFAGGANAQQQGQGSVAGSAAQSEASNTGNNQTFAPVTNNFASDLENQGAAAAAINAAAALEIARIQQTVKNTPSMGGPPLVSSNDTCMGSASGAVSAPGFGLSLGKTYNDTNCVMLKNSRELWNMGMKGAAMARMCMDSDNKAALEMTGFVCPQTAAKQAAAPTTATPTVAQSVNGYTGSDPIVLARMAK